MKALKLAAIPAALIATSAFAAEPVVVDQQVVVQPVAVSTTTYNPDAGIVRNTTTQVVSGTKTFFETVTHPAAISAEVGTLGYGANIGWALNDKTELVAGWAGGDVGDLKDSIDIGDNTYNLETDFSNPYLGVQMRPMSNWFTVGAGTIFPNNEATLKSSNVSNIMVGDQRYTGNLEATVENENDLAPYLTIGFRPNLNNHWGVFGEVGAAYTGGLKVTNAKVSDPITGASLAAINESFKEDLQRDINDEDISDWMPIAKVGVTYRF